MLIHWSGIATVIKAVSAVMIAEIILAYLIKGYSDKPTILLIITISSLMMLVGSFKYKNNEDDNE